MDGGSGARAGGGRIAVPGSGRLHSSSTSGWEAGIAAIVDIG